jgi:hypothetical protein
VSIDPPPLGGDESAERPGFTWSPDWPPPPEVPQAETALKATGLVIVVLLAAMSALYEVLYSPLSSGTTRLPVSLILAIVFNPLLALAAYWSTGRRLTALLPGLAWCAVFFLAATKTREGDLLLTDQNWVGLVTLLAGPVAFAVAVFVPIMREQQRALRENPIEPPAPRKAQPTPGKAPAPGSKPKKAGAPLRPAAKKR